MIVDIVVDSKVDNKKTKKDSCSVEKNTVVAKGEF